jgi:hypothetical protein
MYPVKRGADYAAIERRAHELRREAMDEILTTLTTGVVGKVRGLQAIVASVMLRQKRAADLTFFEAQ